MLRKTRKKFVSAIKKQNKTKQKTTMAWIGTLPQSLALICLAVTDETHLTDENTDG